ncbi:MAG: hypothetical protein J1F64_04985, partial [Oscillospiraceae bacterium]|nr:hypothetical protein [Oscillospiraceae bacterium]
MSGLTAKLNKLIDKLLDRLPERFAAAGVIKRFFNIQFMTFALIGVINTLGMIVFTACMVSVSDRLPDGAAAVSDRLCIPFAAGYALSVVLSFFLNCRFTFK